jgi:hypothetical protein
MNAANPGFDETTRLPEGNIQPTPEHYLPSGRHVVVRLTSAGEELQVRSPDGEVEVSITLCERGPVVRLRAARLELEAADTLALHCRSLEVNAEETIHLNSARDLGLTGQEMRVQTRGDIHLNGDVIRLNC